MQSKDFHYLFELCKNEFKKSPKSNKPYRAYNMLVRESEVKKPFGTYNVFSRQIPAEVAPIEEVPTHEIPLQEYLEKYTGETGFISTSTFTALGALPVADAIITIYFIDENDEEIVLYRLVSDGNGKVSNAELPVVYNRFNPLESSEYYFSNYNLRVQTLNYYTVNILNFRIFPNTKTSFKIDLIPVMAGDTSEAGPSQTFIIPPSPIDISND